MSDIFMNIVVKSSEDAVRQKVKGYALLNLSDKSIAGRMQRKMQGAMVDMAGHTFANPEMTATWLGKQLPDNMCSKMADDGITSTCTCVAVEGPYLLITVKIQKVKFQKSSGNQGLLSSILERLPQPILDVVETFVLPKVTALSMSQNLAREVEHEMKGMGIRVECESHTSKGQLAYLLQRMAERNDLRGKRG
eukprot:GGOE01036414.1.p1 GENE.GGOE01036414.1~~GGOE01036414.1.p1  ORF type:complete len:223 (-),score=60.30 GGOE01036414.1:238-816(-)